MLLPAVCTKCIFFIMIKGIKHSVLLLHYNSIMHFLDSSRNFELLLFQYIEHKLFHSSVLIHKAIQLFSYYSFTVPIFYHNLSNCSCTEYCLPYYLYKPLPIFSSWSNRHYIMNMIILLYIWTWFSIAHIWTELSSVKMILFLFTPDCVFKIDLILCQHIEISRIMSSFFK